jgi:hypothetical protein
MNHFGVSTFPMWGDGGEGGGGQNLYKNSHLDDFFFLLCVLTICYIMHQLMRAYNKNKLKRYYCTAPQGSKK